MYSSSIQVATSPHVNQPENQLNSREHIHFPLPETENPKRKIGTEESKESDDICFLGSLDIFLFPIATLVRKLPKSRCSHLMRYTYKQFFDSCQKCKF